MAKRKGKRTPRVRKISTAAVRLENVTLARHAAIPSKKFILTDDRVWLELSLMRKPFDNLLVDFEEDQIVFVASSTVVTFVLRLRSSRRREHVHWTQIFLSTLVEGSYCTCFESLGVGGQQTLGCGYVRCKKKHAPNELTMKKQILVNEQEETQFRREGVRHRVVFGRPSERSTCLKYCKKLYIDRKRCSDGSAQDPSDMPKVKAR